MSGIGFTGYPLDRADPLRQDAAALDAAARDPRARLLVLTGFDPALDEESALVWSGMDARAEDGELILLGMDGEGRPHFAETRASDPPAGGRSMALLRMLDRISGPDAAIFGAARHLVDWHARHRFCAVCGSRSAVFRAGWGRKCPDCTAEHFPRVDPVVIMIVEHEGRALLGRQTPWPQGRYSALAGFVEPGESLEEAVAREVLEEAGVRVTDVRYAASQPWPFPGQLMLACIARAESDVLTIDRTEIEDAIWVSRADVGRALSGDDGAAFLPPPAYAIARTLLEMWVKDLG